MAIRKLCSDPDHPKFSMSSSISSLLLWVQGMTSYISFPLWFPLNVSHHCHFLFLPIFFTPIWNSLHLYYFVLPDSYLCFSVAPLTFSHVTIGTNLAVSFLERPNSRTQQRESVWVHEGEKERSCHADTITNIQTHNKEKAKKGKQAEACHAGGMQTTDTGRQQHKNITYI